MSTQQQKPTIVKKYANRRLYDTGRSSYITMNDLYEMVQENYEFVVIDTKSGKDLTKKILMQIITEKEITPDNVLSSSFLKSIITMYAKPTQPELKAHLQQSLEAFIEQQNNLNDIS